MKEREIVIRLLRDLARQLNALDDGAFRDVVSGKSKLQLSIAGGKDLPKSSSRKKPTEHELADVAEALIKIDGRKKGEDLIKRKVSSKEDLTRLARRLDVPIQKSDSLEQLRARVIESTIGFRLRSAAIQGSSSPSKKPK